MAKPNGAAAKKSTAPKITGDDVVTKPLELVKPNTWNPNKMTPFMRKSLKAGIVKDGWLRSQALLIWGSDERGREKNIIIDGEHRWTIARELKMTEGPMVFMWKISEVQAKALTIKLGKRGEYQPDLLSVLVRDINQVLAIPQDELALDLGLEEDRLSSYLVPAEEEEVSVIGELPSGQTAQVKMLQLFFKPEDHERFSQQVKDLSVRFKTNNVTDTIAEAVRREHAAASTK